MEVQQTRKGPRLYSSVDMKNYRTALGKTEVLLITKSWISMAISTNESSTSIISSNPQEKRRYEPILNINNNKIGWKEFTRTTDSLERV